MKNRETIRWISDAQVEYLRPRWQAFCRLMVGNARDDEELAGVLAGWIVGVLDGLGIVDDGARRVASRRIRGASANDHRGGPRRTEET